MNWKRLFVSRQQNLSMRKWNVYVYISASMVIEKTFQHYIFENSYHVA